MESVLIFFIGVAVGVSGLASVAALSLPAYHDKKGVKAADGGVNGREVGFRIKH